MTLLSDEYGKLEVACTKCKMWIGYADPNELDVPIRGSMIQRRPGTDHLPLPDADAMGMDLICPFSVTGDPADLHLFVPHIPGREIEADTLELYRKVNQYRIEPKERSEGEIEVPEGHCPCGCSEIVPEGNVYASRGCYARHKYRRK